MNIQDYLHLHYFAAYRKLAEAISDAGELYDVCVVGWDSMNEPNHGMVGLEDITIQPASNLLRIGPMPTAFEAMKLGMGIPTDVESWKFGSLGAKKEGVIRIDPQGATVWLDGESDIQYSSRYGWKRSSAWKAGLCIWALHGVWDIESRQVRIPGYFSGREEELNFGRDFWRPHWLKWSRMIREVHAEAIHFVLPPVLEVPPSLSEPASAVAIGGRAALSTHFYDGLTLVTKHWNWFNADAVGLLRGKYATLPLAIRVGEPAIRKCIRDQLGYLRQDVLDCMGNFPSMMGEIGIPYDLDHRQAYVTGDYKNQSHAMDATLNACEGTNLFSYTLWTYNSENTHQWGENWNGEDLSVYSLDDGKSRDPVFSDETLSLSKTSSSGKHFPVAKSQYQLNTFSPGMPPANVLLPPIRDSSVAAHLQAGSYSGARAVEAFVRPYPSAIAGSPLSIEFDIKSSSFLLVIETRLENMRMGSEEVPTEIYLPAIHYGALSQADMDDIDQASSSERAGPSGQESQGHATKHHLRQRSFHIPHLHNPLHPSPGPALALSVKISCGRYEVEGHTLRWFHGQSEKPEKEKIEIRRRGGPRKEVTAAFGEKPPSLAASIWKELCGSTNSCRIA